MLVIPLSSSFCENVFNTKGKIAQIARTISIKISPKIVPASAGQELTSARKNLPRILITKTNVFIKRKIICHKREPPENIIINHEKSVTCNRLPGKQVRGTVMQII